MKGRLIITVLLIAVFASSGGAVQFKGGAGLFYTQKAETNVPGQFNLSLYGRGAYQSDTESLGPDDHYTSAFHINYGLFKNFEIGVTQLIYQDLYNFWYDKTDSQSPGDTFFHLKWAGFYLNMGKNPLYLGLDLGTSYRTADRHNIYFEEYSGGGVGLYLNFLGSYYTNPENKEQSASFHFNLGYKNHNDHPSEEMSSTQEIPVSVAFLMATKNLDYSVELHGSTFTERTSENNYSSADYVFICPGIKYKFKFGLQIGLGIDINVYQEQLTNSFLHINDIPQYPDYRINLHVTGLFNTIRYAKKKHLERLERVKMEAMEAERILEEKRAERRSWEDRVKEKEEQLEKKKNERDKVKENLEKESPSQ